MALNCLNCGEPVRQLFCPVCGQSVGDRRRPLLGLIGEFFTEFLSLDGRHLRTAVRLWIPGCLTQLYLDGKRASFVPPVRIYFVASLLFFLLVGFPAPNAEDYNVFVDDVLIGREEHDPDLGHMQLLGMKRDSMIGRKVEPFVLPKIERLQAMSAQELVDGFFSGLERTVPTALIFFVPILALAMKLLYVRRPCFYIDHLIFALHFQSFLFMLLVLARLANSAGLERVIPAPVTYVAAFLLLSPIYMLLALRRVYGQGWLLTVIKTGLLGVLYLVLIQPLMMLTMVLVIHSM